MYQYSLNLSLVSLSSNVVYPLSLVLCNSDNGNDCSTSVELVKKMIISIQLSQHNELLLSVKYYSTGDRHGSNSTLMINKKVSDLIGIPEHILMRDKWSIQDISIVRSLHYD